MYRLGLKGQTDQFVQKIMIVFVHHNIVKNLFTRIQDLAYMIRLSLSHIYNATFDIVQGKVILKGKYSKT